MRLYTLGSIYIMKFAIDLSPRSRYYIGRKTKRDFAFTFAPSQEKYYAH